jgi:undecaprenyl-phosphate 4-deoxy-4-formamido-L-arabinose transferase
MAVFLHVVIPAYNASGTVRQLAEQLERELGGYDFRVTFVDDASRDNTREIISAMAETWPNINYFFSPKNQGQQASLLAGLRRISEPCRFVVTMDDDLQNPVHVIPRLIEKIQEGYDLVYAAPAAGGEPGSGENSRRTGPRAQGAPPAFRRLGSRFRDLLFDRFPNKPAGLRVSSFRILTWDLAMKVAASEKKFFYLSAEAFQYNIRAANITYEYVPRPCGRSSYHFGKLLLVYLKILISYAREP